MSNRTNGPGSLEHLRKVRGSPPVTVNFGVGDDFLDIYVSTDNEAENIVGHQTYTPQEIESLHAFLGAWLKHRGAGSHAAMHAAVAGLEGVTIRPNGDAS